MNQKPIPGDCPRCGCNETLPIRFGVLKCGDCGTTFNATVDEKLDPLELEGAWRRFWELAQQHGIADEFRATADRIAKAIKKIKRKS